MKKEIEVQHPRFLVLGCMLLIASLDGSDVAQLQYMEVVGMASIGRYRWVELQLAFVCLKIIQMQPISISWPMARRSAL